MEKIIIDNAKCVGCGACVKDCVASALYLEDGKARFREGCIECGHCFAVCPVDAVDMPGYDNKVIMAAGNFISGSSIELSADGPLREPYSVYFQGGLTFPHVKYGILNSLEFLIREGVVTL